MRNAAATMNDDFGWETAPRKAAPRRAASGKPRSAGKGRTKKGAKRPRFDMHRVARFAAIGMAATMSIGIMVNALVLQKGHHPAPLFSRAAAPAASVASVASVTSQKASPPLVMSAAPAAVRTVRDDDIAAATGAKPAPAKPRKAVVAARDADTPESDDAIGRLLAGAAPAPSAKAKVEAKGDGKTVTGVQRALSKLGFKVPADGAIGPATKKAIEAFEKDRHMAVKGEIDRRLVKVLAAESGIKID